MPYDVSRLRYLEEIEKTTGRPAVPFTAEAIAAGADLSGFSSLVVADMELPAGSTADRGAYVAALKAYATAGGQLVLTDRALKLVDDLTGNPALKDTVDRTDAGHVDFVAPLGDHPYEKGLVGKPSQTFYEVMLGYPSQGRTPNYGVLRTAFEAAGGTTVATVGPQGGASPNTALGTLPLGAGKVVVFGALLPQAIESLVLEDGTRIDTPHPFGLADYAVTITGGQVLDTILSVRPAGGGAEPRPPRRPPRPRHEPDRRSRARPEPVRQPSAARPPARPPPAPRPPPAARRRRPSP